MKNFLEVVCVLGSWMKLPGRKTTHPQVISALQKMHAGILDVERRRGAEERYLPISVAG